jgi:hypothetical protein
MVSLATMVAILSSPPAPAWEGFSRFGTAGSPAMVSAHGSRAPLAKSGVKRGEVMRDGLFIHRQRHPRGAPPVIIWPYLAFDDDYTTQAEVPAETQAPIYPTVIVLADPKRQGEESSRADTPPDYSNVPGCRAIPNGYYCDTHRDEIPH